jgi:hypothetical protein
MGNKFVVCKFDIVLKLQGNRSELVHGGHLTEVSY